MNTFAIALANWSGRVVGTFAVGAPMQNGAVSPDGSMVVSGSTVYAIDGRIVGSLGVDTYGDSVVFSSDNRTICDASDRVDAGQMVLRLLRAGGTPRTLATLSAEWGLVACGPAGGEAVVGRSDPTRNGVPGFAEVAGYSFADGAQRYDLAYPGGTVSSLAVSSDGGLLAEGGWSDGVHLRRLPSGARVGTVVAPGAEVSLFSGDGTRVAIRPSSDSTRVVAWQTGSVLYNSSTLDEPVSRPGRPDMLLVVQDFAAAVNPSRSPPLVQLFLLGADGSVRQTWP